jgi:hypothetical protein
VGELPGMASIGNHPSVTVDSATLAASPDAAVCAGGLNRVLVGAAVGLAALSICCCLVVVPWHRWLAARADINPLYWGDLLMAVVWPAVGALLVRSQPRNVVGWLMVVPALLGPYLLLAHYAVTSALLRHGSLPGHDVRHVAGRLGVRPILLFGAAGGLVLPERPIALAKVAASRSNAGSTRGDHYCRRDGHAGGVGFCRAGAEPVRYSRV